MSSAQPTYEAPGPGPWDIDAVHFPRPVTRYWSELHPEPFVRGFSEFTGFYGMLIAGRANQYVNGFAYGATLPVADEEVPRPASPRRSAATASCSPSIRARCRTTSSPRTCANAASTTAR